MMSLRSMNKRLFELKQRMGTFWNLVMGSFLLLLIFLFGILGFMLIEGWDLLSSFYMVVITLSTVGYGEVHPLSSAGRMFAALLIMSGVGGFMYIVASFSQVLVEGRLQVLWGRRRMQKAIGKLEIILLSADMAASAVLWSMKYEMKALCRWSWNRIRI